MDSTLALYQPNDQDKTLVRTTIAKDLDEKEFNLFMAVCVATGLNPILRQVCPVKYKGRMVIQVEIDGYRLQAQRSNEYRGQLGPFWCGTNGEWKDVWLEDEPPVAAKVGVYRESLKDPNTNEYLPTWGVAKFKSFAKYFPIKNESGRPTGKVKLGEMWESMPDVMIAKCAEAQAIRKAFPAETSSLYVKEEMMSEAAMQRLMKENEDAAATNGKPDVNMPEKNITPSDPKEKEAHNIAQIKELLDEMKADRKLRDKFVAMLKTDGHEKTLEAVDKEYSLFLDQQAAAHEGQ